ncbi:MAG TPA: hypothetical protein VEY06_01940 [Flavisolibacter sp.]|nr:hypothetical protein [Flavisolibacter sp.]
MYIFIVFNFSTMTISPFIDSRAYATGNGFTDDTLALNAWIDAGQNLYLNAGDYKFTATVKSSIEIWDNVNIVCHPDAK